MGVEYRITKIDTGESYDLGKPAHRIGSRRDLKAASRLHGIRDAFRIIALTTPSHAAMWKIGSDDDNCAIFVAGERWNREALAPVINVACLEEDDLETALAIADDILAWAGDDRLVVIPDSISEEDIAERLGYEPREPHYTRSIYDVQVSA